MNQPVMNEPLKSGWFTVDQMFRFVNSLCSWDGCREPVQAPAVIQVTVNSLYCRSHVQETLTDPDANHAWSEIKR
jgi:hypothetical protein